MVNKHRSDKLPEIFSIHRVLGLFPMFERPSAKFLEQAALRTGHCKIIDGKVYLTSEDVREFIESFSQRNL